MPAIQPRVRSSLHRTCRVSLIALACVCYASSAWAQATTVFAGRPTVEISEGGVERQVENIGRLAAANLHCVISKIGDRYFWASRGNKELIASGGGEAFMTFTAVDGSGYIRVLVPDMKKAAALAWPSAEKFDYVEHLLQGLNSVTYYGVIRD